MKKKVDSKMVKEVIKELEEQGEPVSVRKIQAVTGGSMTTITLLYREAQEQMAAAMLVPNKCLPGSITEVIQGYVTTQVVTAISQTKAELAAARAREDETLAILEKAEEQVELLQAELLRNGQETDSFRVQAEKQAAAAEQAIEGLRMQLEDLRAEQRRLAQAGETARTAATLAEQVRKQAMDAAVKSEHRAAELQEKYEALLGQHGGFEKRLAAEKAAAELRAAEAEQKALELNSRLQWMENTMARQVTEAKEDGKKETVVLRERLRVADEALARTEERAARMEAELRELRKPAQLETDKAVNG